MATYTPNYNLKKPAQTDYYDVDDFNGNADILDEKIKSIETAADSHTSNQLNPHNVTKTQVGLGNVDNTADTDKPISTAVQTALNGSVYKSSAEVTLSVESWGLNGGTPYYELPQSYYAAGEKIIVSLPSTATAEQTAVAKTMSVYAASQTQGRLAFIAATTPTIDIPIIINYYGTNGTIIDLLPSSELYGMINIDYANKSIATGIETISNAYQFSAGKYNTSATAPTSASDTTGSLFIVGCGTADTARSNALRITAGGECYGQSSFKASGADVAEMYEWKDGNPNNEDRRGLFVTLDGEQIRLANADDTYILGVISAVPFAAGDVQSETWKGMYLKDVFGAYQKDENGNKILNPEYDPTQEYIPREERPEYDFVSDWGKLVIVDDGTCEVNGFCKVSAGGKATKTDTHTKCRVMKRIDDTHIYVKIGESLF